MSILAGMFSILVFLLLTDTVYRIITKERNYQLEKAKLKIEVAKIVLKEEFYRFKNKLIDNKDAFEIYCGNLLKALNFENVQVTELVGDGGKDIIAYKDGEKYYVECKLWDWEIENNSVGRPVVQKLVGAMVKDKVKRGFIITTSYFTAEALEYASNLPEEIKIELIDGDKLVKLLTDLRKEWIPEIIHTFS
ncbi:restriction endonuclease [Caldanaerobacter subterraneus]|uniref:restriction endonuclease n=1 Tax=Caldanaerobacter subterraneus TaxID=911092 RepID=UPI001F104E09|nr:restriction endonuclease [Caldanaerobacter subterraneus]